MAHWYSGQEKYPPASWLSSTSRTGLSRSARSSAQSAIQRDTLGGELLRIRLASSGRRSRVYCRASQPPQELPNRCSRSSPSAARTTASSSTNRPVVHRPVGPAAAELIVEDHRPAGGEVRQRLQVVVRHAGPAVQAQQRGTWPVRADDLVPDPAARYLDEPLSGRWVHGSSFVHATAPAEAVDASLTRIAQRDWVCHWQKCDADSAALAVRPAQVRRAGQRSSGRAVSAGRGA